MFRTAYFRECPHGQARGILRWRIKIEDDFTVRDVVDIEPKIITDLYL